MHLTLEDFQKRNKRQLVISFVLLVAGYSLSIGLLFLGSSLIFWSYYFFFFSSLALPNILQTRADGVAFKENRLISLEGELLDYLPESESTERWVAYVDNAGSIKRKDQVLQFIFPEKGDFQPGDHIAVDYTPYKRIPVAAVILQKKEAEIN